MRMIIKRNKMSNSKLKFIPSSSQLGRLMGGVNSKGEGKAGDIGKAGETYVWEVFCANELGVKPVASSKQMAKGNMVEEKSLTLYSSVSNSFLEKNTTRYYDDFMHGEPDAFKKEGQRKVVVDVKSSFTRDTFLRAESPMRARSIGSYGWQLISYMLLTDCDAAELAYCFINTPEMIVNDEVRRLWYNMAMDEDLETEQDQEDRQEQYERAEAQIRLLHSEEGMTERQRVKRYRINLENPDKFADIIENRVLAANTLYLKYLEEWKKQEEYNGIYSI